MTLSWIAIAITAVAFAVLYLMVAMLDDRIRRLQRILGSMPSPIDINRGLDHAADALARISDVERCLGGRDRVREAYWRESGF